MSRKIATRDGSVFKQNWRKRQDVSFEYNNEGERKRFPTAPFPDLFHRLTL